MGMIIGKIIGVFIIVFVGLGANKAGLLPVSASKYLSNIVIKLAAPCVVISAMSEQSLDSGGFVMIIVVLCISVAQYAFSVPVGILTARLMGVPEDERGIYKNFILFTNNGFMGFPLSLAMFGHQGMFYMVIANGVLNVALFTLGVANLRRDEKEDLPLGRKLMRAAKDILDVPVIAMLVGVALLALQIRLPIELKEVLDSVGSMMAPLSMMVIGLQLTASKPKEVIANHRLIIVSVLRLLILPGIALLVMLLLNVDPLVTKVLTLNMMLPCGAVPVAMAEAYGRDSKLAAEGTFLTTLFSMITIPACGILLSALV